MNATRYRLVFSRLLGMLVPVAEGTRARGKSSRGARRAALVLAGALLGGTAFADGPAGLVPHEVLGWTNAHVDPARTAANLLTIQQTQPRAVLNWQQFNLERGETVVFDQRGNSSWSALNRIWDADPSRIAGAIRADGTVYLVNQNGIVFKDGAQVNVSSLVASALNVSDDAFTRGLLSLPLGQAAFTWGGDRQQFETSMVVLEPGSRLQTTTGGRVMLLAPRVVNNGSISTPEGQTILAAGSRVFLTAPLDTTLRGFLVEVDPFTDGAGADIGGAVTNGAVGRILAERGNVTLAGLAVNQLGRVNATTSVRLNGSIMLVARDSVTQGAGIATEVVNGIPVPRGIRTGTVTIGQGSVTAVRPELADRQTIQDAQGFVPSSIEVLGRRIDVQRDAMMLAAGGNISLTAQAGQLFQPPGSAAVGDVRVYVDSGAVIDVSGTRDVALSVERNFIEVELRGNELRDAPLQRSGPLRSERVTIDIRKGTPLADVSGYVAQVGRTVGERTADAGRIGIRSEGDVILRSGSTLDVSGGSLNFSSGIASETLLRGVDGLTYRMSEASPDRFYAGFADRYTVTSERHGVTQTFRPLQSGEFQPGYVEGRNAGTVRIDAHAVVLDGTLNGRTVAGTYQREPAALPAGGQLILGDGSQAPSGSPDFRLGGILFASRIDRLAAGFDASTVLSSPWAERTQVDTTMLRAGGFTRIAAYADGNVVVAPGAPIDAGARGSIVLQGRSVSVGADLRAAGGTIDLQSRETLGSTLDFSTFTLSVAPGVRLDAAGSWTNDSPALRPVLGTDPVVVDGGDIRLVSRYDLEIGRGAVLDVSGGAWLDRSGRLSAGDAGSIILATGVVDGTRQEARLDLQGSLLGWALGRGGSVSITASTATVGGAARGGRGEFRVDEAFFRRGGFHDFSVGGHDGVVVQAGTTVAPLARTLQLRETAGLVPTGARLDAVTQESFLPAGLRPAAGVTFTAPRSVFGDIVIEAGAVIRTDPRGSIAVQAGRSIVVAGTLDAPGGRIGLESSPPTSEDGYEADVAIWLAAGSRLSARGVADLRPDAQGRITGEVLGGGTVSIAARKGFIVTERGSVIDVSGTSARVQVAADGTLGPVFPLRDVASAAGTVSLNAREGMLLDGTLRAAPGGPGAPGGSIELVFDAQPQLNFPGTQKRVVLSDSTGFVSVGLQPGDAIDAGAFGVDPRFAGKALLGLDAVRDGGFDSLRIKAGDAVEFAGSAGLTLRRAIEIDAPVLRAGAPGDVRLEAAYVRLGNTDFARQSVPAATGGAATLTVGGTLVDVVGSSALQGFGSTRIASRGDLRLRGALVDTDPSPGAQRLALQGALETGGDLVLAAGQIYPATFSSFRLAVTGKPDGVVAFERVSGALPAGSVLSAGGRLTVEAPVIRQDGVLKAPFGELVLTAGDSLTLGAGSVTSVSGEGRTIPYGRTELSGNDYVYGLGLATTLIGTPPEKRVVLDAPEVNLAGRVDLSGGGDLFAYEFTPGPGGSRDVLDPANLPAGAFAILPGVVGDGIAPFDFQYQLGVTGLRPGDQVYLSGADGLPAGVYTLMPARYALLPGGFLVTPRAGTTDLLPSQIARLNDGSQIVSGHRLTTLLDNTRVGDSRTSGFLVQSGSLVRQLAEYTITRGEQFFSGSGAQLPGDAGRLALDASSALSITGQVLGSVAAGRRGAEVDIDAPRLAVVDGGQSAPSGYVTLDIAQLQRLGASSLLLGGTRTRGAGGVTIVAGGGAPGSEVLVATSSANPLSAAEVLLAATGLVEVSDGAVVRATGSAVPAPGSIAIDGDGALLRVAAGDPTVVVREGFSRSAGELRIGESAIVEATGSLILDATRDTLVAENAVLGAPAASIAAGRVSLGEVPAGTEGLVLTDAVLGRFATAQSLAIKSYSSIDLHGSVTLGGMDSVGVPALRSLTLDAAGIGGYGAGDKVVRAAEVRLVATAVPPGSPFALTPDGTGSLLIEAPAGAGSAGTVTLGGGDRSIEGFASTVMRSGGELRLEDAGALRVAGPLRLDAARIVAGTGAVQSVAASGELVTAASAAAPAQPPGSLGGTVNLSGSRIVHGGRIEMPSGTLTLSATGTGADDGVVLASGSRADVAGRQVSFAPGAVGTAAGGRVTLSASTGSVEVAEGALVDVSGAAGGGDGGFLQVAASGGRLQLEGTVLGTAAAGFRGGSFSLDAGTLPDLDVLATSIASGGFLGAQSYRARSGDLVLGADASIKARNIALAADGGDVDLAGRLDASGAKGGTIETWAGSSLYLRAGAQLLAGSSAAAAPGGGVTVGARDGAVSMASGSRIDVRAGDGGAGGEVLVRAPRSGADIAITALDASVEGAARVVAEGTRQYGFATLGSAQFSTIAADSSAWMAGAGAMRARLTGLTAVRPGVDVFSAGNLTLAQDWNLFTARAGGEPGVLTLRAAGTLNLNGTLNDGFAVVPPATGTIPTSAAIPDAGPSWSYRLVGGADAGAADPVAVRRSEAAGTGDVRLAAGRVVRTGTGFITVAAGGDVRLGNDRSVIYTAGAIGPVVDGFVVPSVSGAPAPAYTVGGGDVRIAAERDVVGAPGNQLVSEWLYRDVRRVSGGLRTNPQSTWWVRFDQFRQGIGALGGGDVAIVAGGDLVDVSAVIPTNGRLGGDPNAAPVAANFREQGGGDLLVRAGGDIRGGLFYVQRGSALLEAGGSLTSSRSLADQPLYTLFAAGDARVEVRTGGDAVVETAFNPTALRQAAPNTGPTRINTSYFFTYGEDAGLRVTSLAGDVRLSNNQTLLRELPGSFFTGAAGVEAPVAVVYPGSVRLAALSGSVAVERTMKMFPSPRGGLELLARNDVSIGGAIIMSDVLPRVLPSVLSPDVRFTDRISLLLVNASEQGALFHSDPPLMAGAVDPIRIVASLGDVSGPVDPEAGLLLAGVFSKRAEILAGRDVRDFWFVGQNLGPNEVTLVQAGRDVRFNTLRDAVGGQRANSGRFELGGEGELQVAAGRSVDLGNSLGLITRGNLNNPFLPENGAAIRVSTGTVNPDQGSFIRAYLEGGVPENAASLAGYRADLLAYMRQRTGDASLDAEAALQAFKDLSPAARTAFINRVLFSELRATGRDFVSGRTTNYDRGYRAIETLFPSRVDGKPVSYEGDLNLFFSQIKTEQGGDIEMRVPGGLANAGLANPGNLGKSASELGIVTARGGTIRGFVRDDFLVNQSRVFTLQGGDILLWASEGNIDAGKGAKTAAATPPPQVIIRGDQIILDTSRSVEGSGIGVLLAREGIEPGDVDLIAPKGLVDAGDAGIRVAGNLVVAAAQANLANVAVGGGISSNVPVGGGGAIGGLAGVSNLAQEATKSVERATETAADRGTRAEPQRQPSFITVEVIGLGEEEGRR